MRKNQPLELEEFNVVKWHRVWAFLLRHIYLTKASVDRKADMVFYPVVDLLTFGLLSVYIEKLGANTGVAGAILGGIILWTLLYNLQRDISFAILGEAWDRNLYNLFATPFQISEMVVGTLILSLGMSLVSIAIILLLAFGLFNFNFFQHGPIVFYFILNLFVFGWAFGYLTSSLIFRFGTKIQAVAWSLILIIYPISGVFYPLSVLPTFLQKIAYFLPISHIFESLRTLIISDQLPGLEEILVIAVLNLLFLTVGIWCFVLGFRSAKRRGWFIHPT